MQVIDAKKRYKFFMDNTVAQAACPADANRCAVADAINSECLKQGKRVLTIQVGPQRTVVALAGGRIIRYTTPTILRKAIKVFDETHQWPLPSGYYSVEPLQKSLTSSYVRERAKLRRAEGDPNMDKKLTKKHITKSKSLSVRTQTYTAQRAVSNDMVPA